MTVISWSYSKLVDFEKCKRYFKLKHIDRIPEPERPLPPGKTEHANDRGTRIHQSCEDYVRGLSDTLAPEADRYFGPQIDLLRTMHTDGLVSLEGEWGLDASWAPWAWGGQWTTINEPDDLGLETLRVKALPDRPRTDALYKIGRQAPQLFAPPWLRMKIDALVMHDAKTATVIDYKTGKKYGNEVKHGEQLQLYALATFMRYPELETVFSELWYLDQDIVTSVRVPRKMGLRYAEKFAKRGNAIVDCLDFPPNPNVHSCRWCQYGPWNGGQCEVGVR